MISARRRTALLAGAALGVLIVAGGSALWIVARPLPKLLPPPSQPLEPDLVTELSEIRAAAGIRSGRQFLYFTTTIGNIGEGPLQLRAHRRNRWTGAWRVSQQFDERSGERSERVIPGTLVWGGHGHDHWHLKFGAAYRIESRGAEGVRRRLVKAGYCFFDQVARLTRTRRPTYDKDSCDGLDRTSLTMGMSVGWTDPYQWTLPDQRIDITGLRDGVYRLYSTADPDEWIQETDEGNNVDWVDVEIDTRASPIRARVVARASRTLPPLRAD